MKKSAPKKGPARRLESLGTFRKAAARIAKDASRSQEAARDFLREAGLITATGKPTKPYR